jgi:hypothetical protein
VITAALDHLVVAARTLDEGVRWCEAMLDVTPGPGGQHPLMGTHNRLLRLSGERFAACYLEIIAIDPGAPLPGRARWFDLDRIDLASGPCLLHAVARVDALDETLAALAAAGIDAGRAIAASRDTPRGLLQWRIAVRDDGARPAEGRLPSLIEWGAVHPTGAMPDTGLRLESLAWRGWPAQVRPRLAIAQVEHAAGEAPTLEAILRTPRGRTVTLRST